MSEFDAAFKGDLDALTKWATANPKKINTNFSKDRKSSLLYTASRFGHFDLVVALVDDFSANVNLVNKGDDKSTPLHGACYGGHPNIVAFLCHRKAKTDVKNGHSETPADNSKNPADGVTAANKKKVQKLLEDSKEAAKVVEGLLKKKRPGAEAAKEDAPAPKAKRKEDTPTAKAPAAAAEKKPAAAAKKKAAAEPSIMWAPGDHPLKKKTVVLTGTFKKKSLMLKIEMEKLGGKATGNVSSKTDLVIIGHNPGDKGLEGRMRGIPVWTEAEFVEVLEKGADANIPPHIGVPDCLLALQASPKLSDDQKKAYIGTLHHALDEQKEENKYGHWLRTPSSYNFPGTYITVGEFGAELLVDFLKLSKHNRIMFGRQNLTTKDANIIMETLLSRKDAPQLALLDMCQNTAMDDGCIDNIAKILKLDTVDRMSLGQSSFSAAGIKRIFAACEERPAGAKDMYLQLDGITGVETLVKEWKAGSGKDAKVKVYCNQ